MCNAAVMEDPCRLEFVPNHLKIQEMCNKAVREDPFSLEYVPNRFVRPQQVNMWYDDYYNDDDYDEINNWHDGYQKSRAQKAKIKEELMPIAWHPSRWWDWCVPEDEKNRQKNCGSNR